MRNLTRASIAGMAGVVGASLSLIPAQAQSLACGGDYTVARGDTLQKISRLAYGPDASYNALYKANRSVVGANPSLIEVGMVLTVPCIGGQQSAASASPASAASEEPSESAESAEAAETVAAAPAAVETVRATPASLPTSATAGGALRIVTATDWAPYLTQDQAQGGMLHEVMDEALMRVMTEDDYKIDFVNDWAAILDPLITDQAYDFSIAWYRPNCDVIEKLGEDSQLRCQQLAWSDPLFEQLLSYYTRADDPFVAAQPSDLFGKTVCRMSGYATYMMEEFDLVEPNITLNRPPNVSDCFESLLEGESDAVLVATTVADDAMAEMGIFDQVKEQPALTTVATLHAVTSVNNADKDAQLAMINEGMRQIREDGKWFEIVQRHLIAHARKTASN